MIKSNTGRAIVLFSCKAVVLHVYAFGIPVERHLTASRGVIVLLVLLLATKAVELKSGAVMVQGMARHLLQLFIN
jgi:hypothetical protein